jgi:hypothetical protein
VIHSCAPQTNVTFCIREYFRTKSAFLLEDTAAVVVDVGAGGAATTTGGGAAAVTDDGMWGVALDNSCKRRSKSATASSGVGGLILVSLLVAADATPSLLLSLGLDIIMMARAVIGSKECIDQLLNLACDVHPTPKNLNSNGNTPRLRSQCSTHYSFTTPKAISRKLEQRSSFTAFQRDLRKGTDTSAQSFLEWVPRVTQYFPPASGNEIQPTRTSR